MNILILSPGRRVELIQFFKEEFKKISGKVHAIDMSEYAPALYVADEYKVLEKDFNNLDKYVKDIIEYCLKNRIRYIMSLIDPELVLLAKNKEQFLANNIEIISSDKEIIEDTFDKFKFYQKYKERLPLVKTYFKCNEVLKDIQEEKISFPLFMKSRTGSGSEGIGKINNIDELLRYKEKENIIFQLYAKKREFGVDMYFDLVDGSLKSCFVKEKLAMRAGETDKSISILREDIVKVISKIEEIEGLKGPIDVDIFEDNEGHLYINEINPRFGGGYVHAYKANVNFIELIINNMKNEINKENKFNYKEGLVMMKYVSSIINVKNI